MIALVPLARFRVQYEVASGRPYSTLEQLVLRAIASGASTVEQLHTTFHLHPRLLVEAVVTLSKAGWVAVGGRGGAGFVLTAIGAQAVAGDEIPPLLTVSPKKTFVLVELVTGLLISNNDVRFVSRRELGGFWDRSVRLRVDVPENALDEGQVQGFLPRQRGEWVRWIGPIDLVSRGMHWLPVDVDIDTGRVAGLPDALDGRLRPYIVDACKKMTHLLDAENLTASLPASRRTPPRPSADLDGPRVPESTFDLQVSPEDLLLSDSEHDNYLARVFESAKTSIIVASAFLGRRRLDSLVPGIDAALKRGVNVDLLWGYAATDDGAGIAPLGRLKKLAYDAQQTGASGKLRFNAAPSSSHAKLVIWDGPGGFEACVGSCNWLSAMAGAEGAASNGSTNASIRLRNPLMLARLARCAAALWQGAQSETLASTGDRWRRVAIALEKSVASGGVQVPAKASCRAGLLFDREHESALRDLASDARARLLVVSHRVGIAAESRLVTPVVDRAPGFRALVLYGTTELDNEGIGRVQRRVHDLGATLTHVPGLHAKVVVGDSRLIISSYNFLSADPFGKSARSRELGVRLDGGIAADVVASHYGLKSDLPEGSQS